MQNVLQISRKVDYALRATIHLARRSQSECISFKEVAKLEDIPKDFLAKILRTLVDAGLVNSSRGPKGGFRLARSPEAISFLDVIEAVEGPIVLNVCLDENQGCSRACSCAMKTIWQRGQARMLEVFRNTNLAELATPAPMSSEAA